MNDNLGLSCWFSSFVPHCLLDHGVDVFNSFGDTTKHHVLSVQMRRPSQRDEELTAICVCSIVGHAEQALSGVPQERLLVLEFAPHIAMLRPGVDGFTASAIVLGKITALNNKVGDNPMEGTSLVKQRLARRSADTLLTGAQRSKILRGQWDQIRIQLNGYPSQRLSSERQVEVHRRTIIPRLPDRRR